MLSVYYRWHIIGGAMDLFFFCQIVLVVTSLGSNRKQFFGSKRCEHFLDCKGLVYHLVDTNRDVSQGAGEYSFKREFWQVGIAS